MGPFHRNGRSRSILHCFISSIRVFHSASYLNGARWLLLRVSFNALANRRESLRESDDRDSGSMIVNVATSGYDTVLDLFDFRQKETNTEWLVRRGV